MRSKEKSALLSEKLNLFQNNRVFFVLRTVIKAWMLRVHYELKCGWHLCSFPILFAYFLSSDYLLRVPDHSNVFRLPCMVWVVGSRLYKREIQPRKCHLPLTYKSIREQEIYVSVIHCNANISSCSWYKYKKERKEKRLLTVTCVWLVGHVIFSKQLFSKIGPCGNISFHIVTTIH